VRLQVDDASRWRSWSGDRATVIQKKTGRPVQFEITEQTRSCDPSLASLRLTRGKGTLPIPGAVLGRSRTSSTRGNTP